MPDIVSPFTVCLAEHCGEFRSLAAELGRRKAKLVLLDTFWALSAEELRRLALLAEDPNSTDILSDALDDMNSLNGQLEAQIAEYVDDANVIGVLARTDFSDDSAWGCFVEALKQAERDLAMPNDEEGRLPCVETSSQVHPDEREGDSGSEDHDEEMISSTGTSNLRSSSSPPSLFAFLSPPDTSALRVQLTGASNLALLRLVNDADAVRAPATSTGIHDPLPISLGHRLTGFHGFVEVYRGPLVWVYDAHSNTDRAARVVSQCAEGNGSATADSWRARASFLPELQLHLASGAMKIDFGGLDRWDHTERQRNITEANASYF